MQLCYIVCIAAGIKKITELKSRRYGSRKDEGRNESTREEAKICIT